MKPVRLAFRLLPLLLSPMLVAQDAVLLGRIVDADSGQVVAARIYVQDANGRWLFPESVGGSAIKYEKVRRHMPDSVEMHTTLSSHPFRLATRPGPVTITIERGKEYFSLTNRVELKPGKNRLEFRLKRWVNMAERGWFSGDTHVHRSLDELPNVMLAEDLNVAFPLVYWVTRAFEAPSAGDKNLGGEIPRGLIRVDDTHVIYPRNTEYEIFTVNGKRHTLGAIFFLNHRSPFQLGAPPIAPVAKLARSEGALLELDKHNWPWSMMLVPVLEVDLFELSNNHVWRTRFGFRNFGLDAPAYMGLRPIGQWTERDWLLYGFRNYYALLNCGFNLRPTAGTASGVHPVPLGFGRVYVHTGRPFSYEKFVAGLDAGRSFVTTGPMLLVEIDGKKAGQAFENVSAGSTARLTGEVLTDHPTGGVEIIRNGEVIHRIAPQPIREANGSYRVLFEHEVRIEESSWVAVRYLESRAGGRVRFAHSGVFHFRVPGRPLRPRKVETDFLIRRMEEQLERSRGVLPESALAEYEQALAVYRKIAKRARR